MRPAPPGLRGACVVAAALILTSAGEARPEAPQVFDPTLSDPRAIAVADLVMSSLGGVRAWEQTRYIYFAFAVERDGKQVAYRTHLWDRFDGRLRYEKRGKDGAPLVALLDVHSRLGDAYRLPSETRAAAGAAGPEAAVRLDAAAAKDLLKEAYEAWINDTYWLLMPYKMKDPGVRLKYSGEETRGGETYDTVELTFANVGLTPGDRYWAHVNRRTHLMDRWSYVLQDDPPGSDPTVWDWKGWSRRGRIMLCPEKVTNRKGATMKILHPILEVFDTLPASYFASPDPLPGDLAERPRPAGS